MSAAPILTISKDGETIKSVPIEGEAMLGRSEGCVIRLEDRAISRQHAVFRTIAGGGVQVEKKSEFAPLSVNGAECTRANLKEGDVIAIGPYLVRFASAKAEPAPAPAPAQNAQLAAVAGPPATPAGFDPLSDSPQLGVQESPDLAAGLGVGGEIDLAAPAGQPQLEATNDLAPLSDAQSSSEGGDGGDGILAPNLKLDGNNLGGASGVEEISTPDFGGMGDGAESPSIEFADGDAKTKVLSNSKVLAKLHFPEGTANFLDVELNEGEVSLGRGKNCNVILEDKKASRKHAIIRRSGAGFTLQDLESANGTFLNGVQVSEQELYGGDVIRIGNTEITFEALSSDYIARQGDFLPVPEEEAPAGDVGGFPSPIDSPLSPEAAFNSGMAGATGSVAPAGIPGISVGGSAKKKTLLEKFRALPKGRQMIWGFIVLGIIYFGVFDDDQPQKPPPPKKVATTDKQSASFESLTPEQQKFVVSEHALAFEYYKSKDYDKALFELAKIFVLIPDYKDSREIERYAREGQKKLQAMEEERRKKEEEDKLKARISELVDQTKVEMDKKAYDQARDMFPQILALDPDNANVTAWSKEVEKYEEDLRIKAEEKSVQDQINAHAWEMYKEGVEQRKATKFQEAMDTFGKVQDIGASDKRPGEQAKDQITEVIAQIAALRDPVLEEAKQSEDTQDYPKAYELYEKATHIDPPHPAGYAGMARIRDILHDRAKGLYIEAVLAESYSDFTTAKKKFQECMQVAPKDDIYHDRASRKLASFFDRTASGDGQPQ
jgi:pSer/pThr/pTyr-binding forkhead associated (FHA) protein/tetratricopeptide (TPR) repeat protein